MAEFDVRCEGEGRKGEIRRFYLNVRGRESHGFELHCCFITGREVEVIV